MKRKKITTFSTKAVGYFNLINWICFAVGVIGVWLVTGSFWALIFCFIASIHLTIKDIEIITYLQGYMDGKEGKPSQILMPSNLASKSK